MPNMGSPQRACLCGVVGCTRHGRRSTPNRGKWGAAYQSNRAVLMRKWNADPLTRCHLCGFTSRGASDPWEPDHFLPVADGGGDHISNLRPAHRSCNRKAGAQLAARKRKERADAQAADRVRRTLELIQGGMR